MVRSDEDLIICDFAQYYHVLDWRSVPLRTAAILACGLPSEARVIRKYTGRDAGIDTLLQAMTVDSIRTFMRMFSKSSKKPESIVEKLLTKKEESNVVSFASPDAYEEARSKIIAEMEVNNG